MSYPKGEICIYALLDPRTNDIRYVGATNNPYARMHGHLSACRFKPHWPKSQWIAELGRLNMRPTFCVLEGTNDNLWEESEQRWIDILSQEGHSLLNKAPGGKKLAPQTKEQISKASLNRIGQKRTPEARAKMSAAKKGNHSLKPWPKGQSPSPETIAKRSAALKGRIAHNKGRVYTDEEKSRLYRNRGKRQLSPDVPQ